MSDNKNTPSQTKAAKFRSMLGNDELSFCMEAHDGLSAKIVEQTGFEAIWGSGLSIATALGVRDRNEASWTQVIDVLEFMSDATSIPIMLDGDTGYGDFNNFRRLVRKLCQRNIAAVCIEDKQFPKTNSFVDGDQELADVDEFCGKIKAGKDTQTDPDFCIVARVEALIAGKGMDEALRRAEAYRVAGADGILIHSKRSTADEVLTFAKEWDNRSPLVIVPTKYYDTPTDAFRAANISLVIWANHNLRSSLAAMRDVSEKIYESQSLRDIEGNVASISDVFTIAGNTELAEAEKRYLPDRGGETKAILLAASRGHQLADLTAEKPKCMLDVRGKPLLRRLTHSLNDSGITDITVVGGYKHEAVDLANINKVVNDDYETTGEVASLACAQDRIDGNVVVSYGDILFRNHILDRLMRSDADITVAIDATVRKSDGDFAKCSKPFAEDIIDDAPVLLEQMTSDADGAQGEWIGLVKMSGEGARLVKAEIETMEKDGSLATANMPDLFNRLIASGVTPHVAYFSGHWLDVNDAFDLADARNFL
ncbi:MAG: phosphoenolpyruvate mutase [Rhodospirillaceae bacterium]|nr:phosphoenolpyruvate mutase [Rhodospirillaceae bacterium]